jgi:CheY-like chemotaxis protein
MKALIIDDEIGIIDLYMEGLSAEGIHVYGARNGIQGIEVAKKEKPDVILLDIIMPKMNGLDVLNKIKADPDIKNIPVYLLTNLPEEASGGKTKELGAAGYFLKANTEPKIIAQTILASTNNKLPGGK